MQVLRILSATSILRRSNIPGGRTVFRRVRRTPVGVLIISSSPIVSVPTSPTPSSTPTSKAPTTAPSAFLSFSRRANKRFAGQSPAVLHHPQPPLHKKGLQTTPQTPRQSLARGLNRKSQRPTTFCVFLVWRDTPYFSRRLR